MPCDAGETKTTKSVNLGFKIGVNLVLFTAPFWMLIQFRGMFLGVGGIVAIVGGVGKLPESWLSSLLTMILGLFQFLNVDVGATRPGCGGTPSTFVSVYWGNLHLILEYLLPSLLMMPSMYFLARLMGPFRKNAFIRAVFEDWHNHDWYRGRLVCCLVFWLDITWMILVRNSIQGVIPGIVVDEDLRLYKEPAQKYMKDGHQTVFCASVVILLVCVILIPAVLVTYLRREMAGQKSHRHPYRLFKIGVFYAPLNDTYLITTLILNWTIRFIIATSSLLAKFKMINFGAISAIKCVQIFLLFRMPPFGSPVVLHIVKVSSFTGLLGKAFKTFGAPPGALPGELKLAAVCCLLGFGIFRVVEGRWSIIKSRLRVDFKAQCKKRQDMPGHRAGLIRLYEHTKAAIAATRVCRLATWKWRHVWTQYARVKSGIMSKVLFWRRQKGEPDESQALLGLLPGSAAGRAAAQRAATKVLSRIAFEFQGQEQLLDQIVERMDSNGDGILSKEELQKGFKDEFSINLKPSELDALVVLFDQDGDGEVGLYVIRSVVQFCLELASKTPSLVDLGCGVGDLF